MAHTSVTMILRSGPNLEMDKAGIHVELVERGMAPGSTAELRTTPGAVHSTLDTDEGETAVKER